MTWLRGLVVMGLVACSGWMMWGGAPDSELLETRWAAAVRRPLHTDMAAQVKLTVNASDLDVQGMTTGRMVLSRPGHGRIEMMDPLGLQMMFLLVTDGTAMTVALPSEGRQFIASSADEVMRLATNGVLGIDAFVAMLQGTVPFTTVPLQQLEAMPRKQLRGTLRPGGGGTVFVVLNDPVGTPLLVTAHDTHGTLVFELNYGAYVVVLGQLMPTELALRLPKLRLTATLELSDWKRVVSRRASFVMDAPAGVRPEAMEAVVARVLSQVDATP